MYMDNGAAAARRPLLSPTLHVEELPPFLRNRRHSREWILAGRADSGGNNGRRRRSLFQCCQQQQRRFQPQERCISSGKTKMLFGAMLVIMFVLVVYTIVAVTEVKKIANSTFKLEAFSVANGSFCANPMELHLKGHVNNPSRARLGVNGFRISLDSYTGDSVQYETPFVQLVGSPSFANDSSDLISGDNFVGISVSVYVLDSSRLAKFLRMLAMEALEDKFIQTTIKAEVTTYIFGFALPISHQQTITVPLGKTSAQNNGSIASGDSISVFSLTEAKVSASFVANRNAGVHLGIILMGSVLQGLKGYVSAPDIAIDVALNTRRNESLALGTVLFSNASLDGVAGFGNSSLVILDAQSKEVMGWNQLLALFNDEDMESLESISLIGRLPREDLSCFAGEMLESVGELLIPINASSQRNENIIHDIMSRLSMIAVSQLETHPDSVLQSGAVGLHFQYALDIPWLEVSVDVQDVGLCVRHSFYNDCLGNLTIGSQFATSPTGEFEIPVDVTFNSSFTGLQFFNRSLPFIAENIAGRGFLSVHGLGNYATSILSLILQDFTRNVTKEREVQPGSVVNCVNTSVDDASRFGESAIVDFSVFLHGVAFEESDFFDPSIVNITFPVGKLTAIIYDDMTSSEVFGSIISPTCQLRFCYGYCAEDALSLCSVSAVLEGGQEELVANNESLLASSIGTAFSRSSTVRFNIESKDFIASYMLPAMEVNKNKTVLLGANIDLQHSNGTVIHIPCVFLPGVLCPFNVSTEWSSSLEVHGSNLLLDLPFSTPFPIFVSFEQPMVLEFSFGPFADVARIQIQNFSMSFPFFNSTVALAESFGSVSLLSLYGLQQGIQLFRTSPVPTTLKFQGGTINRISSALSQVSVLVNIGPTSKSNLTYYLTSTSESAAHVTLELPMLMQTNLTINLGKFEFYAVYDGAVFASVSSEILIIPGNNTISLDFGVFPQTTQSQRCSNWFIDDKRYCAANMLLNEIINASNVLGGAFDAIGVVTTPDNLTSPVEGSLVIAQSQNLHSKKELEDNDPDAFTLKGLITVNGFRYAQTLSNFLSSSDSSFNATISLKVTNIFNVSVVMYSYSIDVHLVDAAATPRYWFFGNQVYPPNLDFPLVSGVTQSLGSLALHPGQSVVVDVRVPIELNGISEKLIRLYDEVIIFKRFCANFRNVQVRMGLQFENSIAFDTTVAINYNGASLMGESDCDQLYRCSANKQSVIATLAGISDSRLVAVQDAKLSSSEAIVAPLQGSKTGAIWWQERVLISDYFITNFSFRLTCGSVCADGFALVFQQSSVNAIGDCPTFSSWCHGYLDISPSFSVIFNIAGGAEIAFAVDGASAPKDSEIPSSFKFGDGQWHQGAVEFDYNRRKLEVYIDGVLQTTAVFGDTMRDTLGFTSTGQTAWVGFTARSGMLERSSTEIADWRYSTVTTELENSRIKEAGQLVSSVGVPFNVTIVSYDSCSHKRINGGDSWSVVFHGEKYSTGALTALDLHNGSYVVTTSIPVSGDYAVLGMINSGASTSLGTIRIS
eukprot:TRINITY_DN1549_c0_g1_i4.p1 TRINITY_DN1549_c0_g1~~TRINITY_DN1549_c0_g1_i4.p1  ORF type:complete len:1572 (-),score=395.25 TRINITY_DN1549_c0_g1_i4:960-5534(-)